MPFVWAKLILWLITIVASIIWFAILALIATAANNGGVTFFIVILWLGGTRLAHFILMRYFGYLIKAGHIAVITEAVSTGQIPENQIDYGKKMVVERFATANVYFLIDNLVSGAVKQLQRVVGKIGDFLKFLPGIGIITNIAQFFLEISLGYIDECCLGYTFYNKDQSAFKSAADGVVIYAQNWKKLLANAAKTMVKVLAMMLVVVIIFSLIFSAILNLFTKLAIVGIAAFIFACFAAMAVKSAFLDSYILVETMVVYMQIAPETVITFNLYEKLCGMSKKFRDLFDKARAEQPIQPQPAVAGAGAGYGGAGYADTNYTDVQTGGTQQGGNVYGAPDGGVQNDAPFNDRAAAAPGAAVDAKPAFCTNCGSKVSGGVKFCGNCGKPV